MYHQFYLDLKEGGMVHSGVQVSLGIPVSSYIQLIGLHHGDRVGRRLRRVFGWWGWRRGSDQGSVRSDRVFNQSIAQEGKLYRSPDAKHRSELIQDVASLTSD